MKNFASIVAGYASKPIKTDVLGYDTLLSFGYLWDTIPDCKQLFAFHPLFLHKTPPYVQCLRYEVGTEFGVSWLLAYMLFPLLNRNNPTTKMLESNLETIDIGYLASETNLAEEELDNIAQHVNNKHLGIVLGEELALHPHAQDIAKLCGILAMSNAIDVIIPQLKDSIHTHIAPDLELQMCEYLPESNGNFVYILPSTSSVPILEIPPLFAPTLQLKDKQKITLKFEANTIEATCHRDAMQKGTIAILRLLKAKDMGYPYKNVEVIP